MSLAWHEQAACAGMVTTPETDLWHDLDGSGGDLGERRALRAARVRDAKAICTDCPAKQACLDDAAHTDATHGTYGIRGGLTPQERIQRRAKGAA